MMHPFRSLLLWGLFFWFSPAFLFAQTIISQNITQNTTWDMAGSPYVLTTNITINTGVTLAIEPGVVVKHQANDLTDMLTVNGTLLAQGTAQDPVVFTDITDDVYGGDTNNDGNATSPHPGDWGGVRINPGSGNSSLLEYCLFRFGGYETTGGAALEINDSSPLVSNCTFFQNEKGLTVLVFGSPTIADNLFEENTVSPISLSVSAAPVFSGNAFQNNNRQGIGLETYTFSAAGANYTLPKRNVGGLTNVPYLIQNSGLTIGPDVTLTIEPGVVIKHDYFDFFDIITINGTLIAQGTDQEPIVFTDIADDVYGGDTNNDGSATAPHAGDWEGVRINAGSGNTSVLEHCLFRFGGNDDTGDAALEIAGASPSVSQCTFFNNEKGLSISANGAPQISDCTFQANTVAPVAVSLDAEPSFSNIVLQNNLRNGIGLETFNYNTSGASYVLEKPNLGGATTYPYLIQNNNLTIGAGVTLTIEPGVVLKHDFFDFYDMMTINGTLIAQGTAQDPIVFTDIADDAYGGDTNNDGNTTAPHPGDWEGIRITAQSGNTSILEHCIIRYGGDDNGNGAAGIEVDGSSPTISNCSIAHCGTGLSVLNGGAPVVSNNSFTGNTTIPILIALSAQAEFQGNIILNNTLNGIGILAQNYNASGSAYVLENPSGNGIASIPYVIFDDGLTIGENVSLQIEPGVVVKFLYTSFDQLYVDVHGTVTAQGTPQAPVVFTSVRDDQYGGDTDNNGNAAAADYGDWYGWVIHSTSGASSLFSHCQFRHGGYYSFSVNTTRFGAVRAEGTSAPTVDQCTFFQCSDGVAAVDNAAPVITNNQFQDCGWVGVSVGFGANPTLAGNAIYDLTIAGLGLFGENTAPADYVLPRRDFAGIDDIPYLVRLPIALGENVNLTLQPGVVVKFWTPDPFYNLSFSSLGRITAEGTQGQPIIFTSWRDDEAGGDTNYGSPTPPSDQDWYGVILQNPGAEESSFRHCQFRYGGFRDQSVDLFGALRVEGGSPQIEHCDFFSNRKGLVTLAGALVVADSCNFQSNLIGLSKEGGEVEVHHSNFEGNTSLAVQNLTSDTLDATFNWWGDASGPFHPSSNPAGLGEAVSDHVLFDPWQNQEVAYPNDIGVSAILAPASGCGLIASETVVLELVNHGNLDQSGFAVALQIDNSPPLVENVGGFLLPAQSVAEYTLTLQADLSAFGDYQLRAYTQLPGDGNVYNDTIELELTHYQPIDPGAAFSNLIPEDGAENLTAPVLFSWSPIQQALSYDLFLWEATEPEPSEPAATGLSQIIYSYQGGLNFGSEYRWKVVARNPCGDLTGPVQSFLTSNLPDLAVTSLTVPLSPFSGQEIEVSWEVVNQGVQSTGSTQWFDAVFLSIDPILDAQDVYLGAAYNNIALNPGEGYAQSAVVDLPDGLQGDYFLFIVADRFDYLEELDEVNNAFYGVINVSLTPPPDLQVTAFVAPGNAFSEQTVEITWTVTNQGTGPTVAPFWRDRIFLSPDSTFVPANAFILGTFDHIGALAPGESYTDSKSVALPQGVSGIYFFYVQTDRNNQVYEFVNENNNITRSDTIQIFLTPPPDLVVPALTVPASAGNLQTVVVQWEVLNQGASVAAANWFDRLYISPNSLFDPDEAQLLQSVYQNVALAPGESYSDQASVVIPDGLSGPHFIHLLADGFDQVFEYINEDNNGAFAPIEVRAADLAVTGVAAPPSVNSGQVLLLEWQVTNLGPGSLSNLSRQDKIFLSSSPAWDPGAALLLDSLAYGGPLLPGQSASKQKDIALPDGLSGAYYLFVFTDAEEEVFEAGSEANNVGSAALQVVLSPWPDLVPLGAAGLPDTLTAGLTLNLSYQAANQGTKAIQGEVWTDRLYLSPDPVWNPVNAVPLHALTVVENLAPGANYQKTASFPVPVSAAANGEGEYYLYVVVDDANALYEHTDEDNNVWRSDPLYVKTPLPVDLAVLSASTPVTVTQSGQQVQVTWSVGNNGSPTQLWNTPLWYDGFYLSTDDQFGSGDLFVKEFVQGGPLATGDSYLRQETFLVPPGLEGDYFLFLATDHAGLTNDPDLSNNVVSVTGATPIFIEKTFYPDLAVQSFQAPATGTAGQPIAISYTVNNLGEGPALPGDWTDKVYLSTDFNIGGGDPILGTFNHTAGLDLGADYSETKEVFLPITASGNYILLFKTDANNAQYENLLEANNIASATLTVTVPPPSDLVVSEVIAPASATVGQTIGLEWTVTNTGANPAVGIMKEVLYLSKDTLWDLSDIELAEVQTSVNLPPSGSVSHSHTATLPGVATGDYYVVVQTDALNNIFESDDSNNLALSAEPMQVSIPLLPLGELTPDVLENAKGLYYRIEIPDTLKGETLLVTLTGDANGGINELYLSHGVVPTRSSYEYSAATPFESDQELVVPALDTGVYYLLAYGVSQGGGQQDVTLLAEILPFEIRSVHASKGGNTGSVTVRLDGSKLEEDMEVRLEDDDLGTVVAHELYFQNSTLVYATFNLMGAELGLYDVVAENAAGAEAVLPDGFEVVAGSVTTNGSTLGGDPGSGFSCSLQNIGAEDLLSQNALHPTAVRPNRIMPIVIQFQNTGNIDIPTPTRYIFSLEGAPLAFSIEDLVLNYQELILEFREEGGPPNVLRPGASGSIKVFSKAVAPLNFYLTQE